MATGRTFNRTTLTTTATPVGKHRDTNTKRHIGDSKCQRRGRKEWKWESSPNVASVQNGLLEGKNVQNVLKCKKGSRALAHLDMDAVTVAVAVVRSTRSASRSSTSQWFKFVTHANCALRERTSVEKFQFRAPGPGLVQLRAFMHAHTHKKKNKKNEKEKIKFVARVCVCASLSATVFFPLFVSASASASSSKE